VYFSTPFCTGNKARTVDRYTTGKAGKEHEKIREEKTENRTAEKADTP
jgi:hypothetical protein